jgi:hypothetical protein
MGTLNQNPGSKVIDRHYAEEVNYWKTGSSAPEVWIDKTKREIRAIGGEVVGSADITEDGTGHSAFAVAFRLQGQDYQIKWPILRPKQGDLQAARRQAATAMYYDVKAMCVKSKFLGARPAFMPFLQLPDGRTAAEASNEDLAAILPKLIGATPCRPALMAGK